MSNKNILFLLASIFIIACGDSTPTNEDDNNDFETITDIDGNTYRIVQIGDQWWMAENLKVTHYRNGDPIPNITSDSIWMNLTTGAYCEYDNDIDYVSTYGRYYNGHAVEDSRNITPAGWHVATMADWGIMIDYLGGGNVAGGKLKEKGYTHWQSPNGGATNESGFTGLPAGARSWGSFGMGKGGWFLTYAPNDTSIDYFYWILRYYDEKTGHNPCDKITGWSIRCIKD